MEEPISHDEELRLGQQAVVRGWITASQLVSAIRRQHDAHVSGQPRTLPELLLEQGMLDHEQLLEIQADTGSGSPPTEHPPTHGEFSDPPPRLETVSEITAAPTGHHTILEHAGGAAGQIPEPEEEIPSHGTVLEHFGSGPGDKTIVQPPDDLEAEQEGSGSSIFAPTIAMGMDAIEAIDHEAIESPTDIQPVFLDPDLEEDSNREPRFGRYVNVHQIGEGGMGKILKAIDPDTGRPMVIKVNHIHEPDASGKSRSGAQTLLQRFLDEGRVTAQLEHPNIVPIHEIAERNGRPYFTMKYVEGRNLQEILQEQGRQEKETGPDPTDLNRHLRTLLKVCDAIAYAHSGHQRSVIHRDLKPENIMIGKFGMG